MIKPEEGLDKDWVFEAGSSQQADDDLPWLYCGIIYNYNETHVVLNAPHNNNQFSSGRAFCLAKNKIKFYRYQLN